MKISTIQCSTFKESRWDKSKCAICLNFLQNHSIIENKNLNNNNNNNNNNKATVLKEKHINNSNIKTSIINNNKENKNNSNNNTYLSDNNNIFKEIKEKQEEKEEEKEKVEEMDSNGKPIFIECLEFKMNQWRPNICVQCFLPKNKHKNVSNTPVESKPIISQSSQTSTITPVSSSTSTKTSTITTHKNANNKTVITYISSTTTTTTTTTNNVTPALNNIINQLPLNKPTNTTSSPSTSKTASPNLKSVSPSSYTTVVVPPINSKSMSTPGSPILSRSPFNKQQQQHSSTSGGSQIYTSAPKVVPVLKRQFQSFPSIPKLSKATLEQNKFIINNNNNGGFNLDNKENDPIILCKYTIESQPPNLSLLKPTLVEFVNQPESDTEKEEKKQKQEQEHQQPQSPPTSHIQFNKSVSITISTSSSTSPSSTTTTTSTTTSIIAEEPSSPIISNISSPTASTIPMSPSLPSIPFHKFETNSNDEDDDDDNLLGINDEKELINNKDEDNDFNEEELNKLNSTISNTTILSGSSSCSSKRNSMNIQPLRLKSFSFSAPNTLIEDDPFEGFEDLVDDDITFSDQQQQQQQQQTPQICSPLMKPQHHKQPGLISSPSLRSQPLSSLKESTGITLIKQDKPFDEQQEEEDIFKDFEDFTDDETTTDNNNNNNNGKVTLPSSISSQPSTITTITTTILSPNIEKTTTTSTLTSTTSGSPSSNSRSINLMTKSTTINKSNTNLTSLIPPKQTSPSSSQIKTISTTTTSKRRSIKMDQFKENEDEWDNGVDLTSFLKKKPSLQRDFSYYNNKFMEISGVKEEVKKQSIDFGGSLHPNAFEAFKGILEAKQTQIKKAFERKKINEPDCDMLINELNSAQKLLDDLLEINENPSSSSTSSSLSNSINTSPSNTLNNQSICIKSE